MKRPQFNLRTIFIAVTLIAVVLAVIVARARARQERIRLTEIQTLEWAIAHPDEWTAQGGSKSEYIEKMKKGLAELTN
jgi:hypothetical protein